MIRDPILAVKRLPPGDGYRVARSFRVEGGLHNIAGNSAPYFSLTYTAHRVGFPDQCYSGGAGHDEILKHFPRFADLAALHLSDINGEPMHAEANGWYWLAGAMYGAGERFHGANGEPRKTVAECLAIFASHCRITAAEAEAIRAECLAEVDNNPDGWPAARATFALRLDDMRPRWRREAEACIAAHNLRVYGDPWTDPTVPEPGAPLPGEATPRTAAHELPGDNLPRMMPGQDPYTADEYARLTELVGDASAGDPGEAGEVTA